jgi:hypothetical protein
MKIGIVSLYPFIKNIKTLVNAVESLGHTTKILNLYSVKSSIIYELIKKSNITHWIFSGSPLSVVEKKSPKIPIEILDLEDKKFMLICYSMESMIFQLNYPITIRRELKKEVIRLLQTYKKHKKAIIVITHDKDLMAILDKQIKPGNTKIKSPNDRLMITIPTFNQLILPVSRSIRLYCF